MSEPATTARAARLRRVLAFAAVCAAAIWCFAPALRAYFAQDDFTLLALARLLHEPWLVFYRDHFPGSLYFRPLGVLVWWIGAVAFGPDARGEYALNLALHLASVGALYTLLQGLRRNAPLNAGWAALYAVHPLAVGTALWLSDRFDLLATTFSLLALAAALRYVRLGRFGALATTLGCLLLAFAGKEIAIVGALAVAALVALPGTDNALPRRARWLGAGAVLLLIAAWLGYRHALFTNPQQLLVRPDTAVELFSKGTLLWLRIGVEYLAADPRQGTATTLLVAVGAGFLAWAIARGVRGRTLNWGLIGALVILILLPGPTQAPVVAVSAADLGPQTSWFDLIGDSRLYHLTMAGLVLAAMLLTTPCTGAPASRRAALPAAAALIALIAAWAPLSHRIAHDYASRTRAMIAPLQAAHAAIARLPLPARQCQIYLLDSGSIWGLAQIGDATIKATSPQLDRIDHCFVNTERTPWGHFLRRGSIADADYAPMRPLLDDGKPVPWLQIGGLECAYLDLGADIDPRSIDGAFFLAYGEGAFADVSADVRSGARVVRFYNARPDQK